MGSFLVKQAPTCPQDFHFPNCFNSFKSVPLAGCGRNRLYFVSLKSTIISQQREATMSITWVHSFLNDLQGERKHIMSFEFPFYGLCSGMLLEDRSRNIKIVCKDYNTGHTLTQLRPNATTIIDTCWDQMGCWRLRTHLFWRWSATTFKHHIRVSSSSSRPSIVKQNPELWNKQIPIQNPLYKTTYTKPYTFEDTSVPAPRNIMRRQ